MITEVFIPEVLKAVVAAMEVPKIGSDPAVDWEIQYDAGRSIQIINALRAKDGSSLSDLKYPLIAAVMPIPEKNGSGFTEVIFPRIVIAYLTKTGTNSEYVMDKYNSGSVLKDILNPCYREFMNQLAWSKYTGMGDPEMFEHTYQENLSQQPLGEGLTDFVDIIEILNLKAIIFTQIKTC